MIESVGAMSKSQPEMEQKIVDEYLNIANLCIPAEEKPMVRIVKESVSVRSLPNPLPEENRWEY